MKILIYEYSSFENLFPLNMLRANFDLCFGAETIKESIERIVDEKYDVELLCRNYMKAYLGEIHSNKINTISKDDYLLLNGSVIFSDESLKSLISKRNKNTIYKLNGKIAAAFISKENYAYLKNKSEDKTDNTLDEKFFDDLNLKQSNLNDDGGIQFIEFPWDLIKYLLGKDFEAGLQRYIKYGKKFSYPAGSENFIARKKIYLSKTAKVFPGTVIDASEGIVIIAGNAVIQPFSYIKGPAFIGENCLIKSGTKIYGPCVIGKNSKVAGEIGESIFHSYVNKQHDGFIGHSYICPFVNLGADTVTSDLKNNYSQIKIKTNDSEISTGMQFLGSLIGDHSKTSINTMLNTGSLVGIFANIFGGGFPDKLIGSFSWNEAGKPSKLYELSKALETAKIVMDRRGIAMTENYSELVKFYFNKNQK